MKTKYDALLKKIRLKITAWIISRKNGLILFAYMYFLMKLFYNYSYEYSGFGLILLGGFFLSMVLILFPKLFSNQEIKSQEE